MSLLRMALFMTYDASLSCADVRYDVRKENILGGTVVYFKPWKSYLYSVTITSSKIIN